MKFDRTKIYTQVNADEVLIGSRGFLGNCVADLEKQVASFDCNSVDDKRQLRKIDEIRGEDEYFRFMSKLEDDDTCGSPDASLFYLVEEPVTSQYRPYINTEEMIKDIWQRAGNPAENIHTLLLPQIWVKRINDGETLLVTRMYDGDEYSGFQVCIADHYCNKKDLLEYFIYPDGSPCGMKI